MKLSRSDLEQTLPARFESVVARAPGHPALAGDGDAWTYARLNGRANQLARALAHEGPAEPGCVASLIPLSAEAVLATLAVLKAGQVSLALHPGLPDEGLRRILDDAAPHLLLATSSTMARARALAAGRFPVLAVETAGEGHVDANLPRAARPDDPAIIYYTSGTTGAPKGVVKSHRAVLHRVWLYAEETAVTPADRQSLLTSCGFASSESDLFGALLNGATLCPFDLSMRGLDGFRAWLTREGVSLLHPPVAWFRQFLNEVDGASRFPRVRLVALSGDTVRPGDVAKWRRLFGPDCVLLHRFSTTETGVLTVGRLEARNGSEPAEAPAGQPVPDKELSLDAAGELVVRSRYLASGYWRRPQETAAGFAAVPGAPGERLYRTGDRGVFLPDGRFVHQGRRDHLVKVRGYRVDLREVESALQELAPVREAVVVAPSIGEEVRLTACVVAAPDQVLDERVLRRQLSDRLPAWKIPGRIRILPALPVTASGKVDRVRLEQEDREGWAASHGGPEESAGSVDERLAALWRDILGRADVPRDGHFFDLGGQSIQALVMLHRAEQAFAVRLDPSLILRHPRLADLAAHVREEQERQAGSVLVPLREGGDRPPLYVAHSPVGDTMWCARLLPHLDVERPIWALRPPRDGDLKQQFASLAELAAHYAEELHRFQPAGAFHLLGYSFSGRLAFETARQLAKRGRAVGLLGIIDVTPYRRTYAARDFLGPLVRYAPNFLKNLPYFFLDHFWRRAPGERGRALRAKSVWLARTIRQMFSRSRQDRWDYEWDDKNYQNLPEETRNLRRALIDLLRAYRPAPGRVRVTLFRVRATPLLRPHADDYGWGPLAEGGVEVQRLPGTDHGTLIALPQAKTLADRVNQALRRAGT